MKEKIEQAVRVCVAELFNIDVDVELTRPDEQFGDYATNVALKLAKQLGQNPREVAQQIVDALTGVAEVTSADIAGPGFINIHLTDASLVDLAAASLPQASAPQAVVIETNNPNPFKAMHIGHAYNATVADTIANLIEVQGHHVYRVSYHGDVGLHVGKSMYSLLRFVDGDPAKLDTVPEAERNSFMSSMYALGSKAYKEDETAKAEIDVLAKESFTRQDSIYAAVYDTCKAWSFQLIDETVARLGNRPTERRFLESDADVRGVKIVQDHTPEVFQQSDGALIFPGSKYGSFDNAFVSSRGLGLYGARDMGLMQLKNEYYHPQKSYVVTGGEQAQYFQGVLAAAGQVWPDQAGVTVNIPTGLVKLTTGKMSSRDGDVVEISWLFEKIAAAITERGGAVTDEIIAGSIRYQLLKVRVGSDVVFDINESVSLQGNSGPYLQYAHARARSILAKKPEATGQTLQGDVSLQDAERTLLRKIGEYSGAVERATTELMPHHVCTYLYDLAQTFNRFYEHNRVLDDEREATRLSLVAMYAHVLHDGLALLGIHAPEKM